jgi:large subunit ribosomal protein L24
MKSQNQSPKLKIRKGDLVEMRVGKDRGKRGRIIEVRPAERRVIVEGLNLVRRHRRPRRAGQKGEIIALPRPVPVSNVMLVCPACDAATRVGVRRVEDSKLRVCKRCGHEFS